MRDLQFSWRQKITKKTNKKNKSESKIAYTVSCFVLLLNIKGSFEHFLMERKLRLLLQVITGYLIWNNPSTEDIVQR